MSLLALVRIIALLSCGLFAGILFGDRMGASFARPALSPSSFVQFQQIQHAHFVKLMPSLLLTTIAAGLVWLILVRVRWNGPEFWLVALATAALICAAILTRAVNIPINNQLMTWSVAAPPADMREIWSRWESAHTVRTILCLGAFALEVVALGLIRVTEDGCERPLVSGRSTLHKEKAYEASAYRCRHRGGRQSLLACLGGAGRIVSGRS